MKPSPTSSDQSSSHKLKGQLENLYEVPALSGKASRLSDKEVMVVDGLPEANRTAFVAPKKQISTVRNEPPRS